METTNGFNPDRVVYHISDHAHIFDGKSRRLLLRLQYIDAIARPQTILRSSFYATPNTGNILSHRGSALTMRTAVSVGYKTFPGFFMDRRLTETAPTENQEYC